MNITGTHQPEIEWLLVALSTFQPNHRFFGKSYYPSDEELRGIGAKVKNENEADYEEFFDDLP